MCTTDDNLDTGGHQQWSFHWIQNLFIKYLLYGSSVSYFAIMTIRGRGSGLMGTSLLGYNDKGEVQVLAWLRENEGGRERWELYLSCSILWNLLLWPNKT